MSEAGDDISPEEKLLKVIQGGQDEGSAPGATASAVGADAPAAAQGGNIPVGTSSLGVIGGSPAVGGKPAGMIGDGAPSGGGMGMIGGGPSASQKKTGTRRFGLATVNRCLVGAVLFMLALAGIEIWANVNPSQTLPPEAGPLFDNDETGREPKLIEVIQASFGEYDLFHPPEVRKAKRKRTRTVEVEEEDEAPKDSELAAYARNAFDLIGRGGSPDNPRAIVVDTDENKTYFLRIGERIVVQSGETVLVEIHDKHVVFACGEQKVRIQ